MQKQTHSLISQAQMHIVKCCCIGLLIVVMNEKDNHLISFNFLKKFLKIELFPFLYKIPATALTQLIFFANKTRILFKTRQNLFRSKGELQTNVNTLIFQ